MLMQKNTSTLFKLSLSGLVISLALVLFTFTAGFSWVIFSWGVSEFNFKNQVLAIDFYQRLVFGLGFTVLNMSISLFFSQSFLRPRMEEIVDSVGEVTLAVLSLILSIMLFILFYFSFSMVFQYTHNNYWI